MFYNFIYGTPNAKMYWQMSRMLLVICNTAGIFIYGFLHFLFFDFPFETINELKIVAKIIATASCFALSVSLLVLLCDAAEVLVRSKKAKLAPMLTKTLSAAAVLLVIFLLSCNGPIISAGIKKDFNTGMSSSYTGMEPAKVFLVMNGEELSHTDIPLGESFLLINDGINGIVVKDGKVKVGCSLSITDQQGKVLLDEKDLFAGHDEFAEKDAKMLKCTVSTGEPMKWEEKYNVAVTFWDKNGTGKIENKVTIRSIDIP